MILADFWTVACCVGALFALYALWKERSRRLDVLRARLLERPEHWEKPRSDEDLMAVIDSAHSDPVTHAAAGCLYCVTACEIVRSIVSPDAWDRAFEEQLDGGGYR